MFATKFCLAIATATLLTTAATAAEPRDAATGAPLAAPTAVAGLPVVADKGLSQRYCIVDDITGSRIPRRECATLAEWQVRGVEPRRMPRR